MGKCFDMANIFKSQNTHSRASSNVCDLYLVIKGWAVRTHILVYHIIYRHWNTTLTKIEGDLLPEKLLHHFIKYDIMAHKSQLNMNKPHEEM